MLGGDDAEVGPLGVAVDGGEMAGQLQAGLGAFRAGLGETVRGYRGGGRGGGTGGQAERQQEQPQPGGPGRGSHHDPERETEREEREGAVHCSVVIIRRPASPHPDGSLDSKFILKNKEFKLGRLNGAVKVTQEAFFPILF